MIPHVQVFYNILKKYEVTINPNDKHQFFGSPRRLELFVMDVQKLLIKAFDNYNVKYRLYIELSEPKAINKEDTRKCSAGSRLHMHGYILFDSNLVLGNYLLKSQYYLSRWADIQVNEYREDYWSEYCVKQKPVMKALSKHYKVSVVLHEKMPLIKR